MIGMEDRYEVLDVVARGAMATVWRARDVRLGRIVAVKRPHPAQNVISSDETFTAAARSAAVVTHPNLVTVFDTGSDDTGAFLVMEFVDGPTVAEMGGAPDGAAALGSAVASGLSALHAAGIVHGDVRPANILLSPVGPKLTNFATARALDTSTNPSVTTPRFEAPEVLAGDEPDKAADVYSLGAVLSWLAGQAAPDAELTSVIEHAMAQDPDARPTAATLAERLHRIAPGHSVTVAAPIVAGAATLADPPTDATLHFDEPPAPVEPPEAEETSASRLRTFAALIAVVLLTIVAAVLASGGDDEPGPVAVDTTTVEPATTTTVPDSETDAPETTEADEGGGVFNTVRIFVTFIRETPRNVLTRTGADEIISDVADGVSEAIRGNTEEAQSNLADAVETVQEEVDSESVIDRAIELITRLAQQLGLDVEQVVEPG